MVTGSFESLSPGAVVRAVEDAYALPLDGTLEAYPSYVNRVYGIRGEDGARYVAKFYRPGRWTRDAVLDEHRFLLDCAEAEVPVIAPLRAADSGTLQETTSAQPGEQSFQFALFPRTGGRTYEPESAEDLRRLGALLGRCHAAAAGREAPHRALCTPQDLTAGFVEELLANELVHPECRDEFKAVCDTTLQAAAPLFEGLSPRRIHGDCHRGNILQRGGQGLGLIEFDDMMRGPPV